MHNHQRRSKHPKMHLVLTGTEYCRGCGRTTLVKDFDIETVEHQFHRLRYCELCCTTIIAFILNAWARSHQEEEEGGA